METRHVLEIKRDKMAGANFADIKTCLEGPKSTAQEWIDPSLLSVCICPVARSHDKRRLKSYIKLNREARRAAANELINHPHQIFLRFYIFSILKHLLK